MSHARRVPDHGMSFAARAVALLLALTATAAFAQQSPPPAAPAAPAPIPLAEVATQAESTSLSLREISADLAADKLGATVAPELPTLSREIDARVDENSKILARSPSLETLRGLETGWQSVRENLDSWTRNLTNRATQLDRELTRLNELDRTWSQTLQLAKGAGTPPEVAQRVEAVIGSIRQTRTAVERQRAQILTLQNRVAAQEARVAEALGSVKQAREAAVNRLLVQDSPPLWSTEVRSRTGQDMVQESQNTFSAQRTALIAYGEREPIRFVLHAAIFVLLAAGLYWARRRLRLDADHDESLRRTLLILDLPIATALVLSILASGWLYPQAPRLLWTLVGAVALIPTVRLLRRLIESHLFPILNALVVFYFIDLLRAVAASLPLVSRLLFLAEMLGAIGFLVWLLRSIRSSGVLAAGPDQKLWRAIRIGARLALVVLMAASIANAAGYVTLSALLGNAVLDSAYLAVILYAASTIAEGLLTIALRVRPLGALAMVREHRALLRRRGHLLFRWTAFVLWLLFVLEQLSLRAPVIEEITTIITTHLKVGSLNLSLGDLLAFGIAVWASFMVSRFVRFLLEEDVYPRLHLARGLPYAISTMLHYAILVVGFFIAVAALGFDMTRFTILAGAFSVGIGFGLQNIVNNFVSGLILLFERPVKVGDVIQLDDSTGSVERIGIRASIIRTPNGADIIVPNGRLISERVTNWTLSSPQRGMDIPVSVAAGTDPAHVIELLKRVAAAHPLVVAHPPPQALFVKLGADALGFELRAWTDHVEVWAQVRSDLALAINTALAEEKISVK